jgi:hypothetical protein
MFFIRRREYMPLEKRPASKPSWQPFWRTMLVDKRSKGKSGNITNPAGIK